MDQEIKLSKKETVIVAVATLSLMMGLVHPLFWMLSVILMGLYWKLFETGNDAYETPKVWVWLVPFIIIIAALSEGARPFAPDDLLRSVVSHHFNYDYTTLYPDAPLLPQFNLWFVYEYALGHLDRLVGPELTVRITVMFIFTLFMTSLCLAVAKICSSNRDKWLIVSFLMILAFITPIGGRALIGRPEVLFTALLFAAVWMKPIVWVVLSILLAPLYWLAPIYAAGALLLRTNRLRRVLYAALIASAGIAYWYHYSAGAWIDTLMLVPQWEANRLLPVSELKSINGSLTTAAFLSMIGFIFFMIVKLKKARVPYALALGALLALFLFPNLTRYIATVGGLIIMLVAAYLPKDKLPITNQVKFILFLLLCLLALKYSFGKAGEHKAEPVFHLPENAYLLSEFNEGLYNSILRNPHAKFAPSYEFGANTHAVQEILEKLFKYNIADCDALLAHDFTHFQEKHLNNIPDCLQLDQVYGEWRLWKIIK